MRAYSPTKLTDNFFLGGATSLRGFGMWGVGPRQNGIKTNLINFSYISMRKSYMYVKITINTVTDIYGCIINFTRLQSWRECLLGLWRSPVHTFAIC